MSQTIIDDFYLISDKIPNQIALKYKKAGVYASVTFAELREKVEKFAKSLSDLGYGRDSRLAILSENRYEWVIADLATQLIGAMNVPIYPTLSEEQTQQLMEHSESQGVVVSTEIQLRKVLSVSDRLSKLKNIFFCEPHTLGNQSKLTSFHQLIQKQRESTEEWVYQQKENIKPGDVVSIVYTSGTTALPKGVMLTHKNFRSNYEASKKHYPSLVQGLVCLSILPLSHVFERTCGYYLELSMGMTICYAENMESIANDMLEIKPHAMIAVPRFFEKVYGRIKDRIDHSSWFKKKVFQFALKIGQKRFDAQRPLKGLNAVKLKLADKLVFQKIKQSTGGRLKFFVSGGAALSPEIAAFFDYVGLPIYEGYGQTEAAPVLASNPEGQIKIGSIGKALPGLNLKIAEDGELLAQGPNVMKGYLNDPQATRDTIDSAGWLHTGDIARLDEEGYYFIIDRKKEMIVMSNGKKVAPAPIENKINLCPYIVQSNLIGEQKNYITALIVPDFEKIKKNNPELLSAEIVNKNAAKKVYFEKDASKLYEYLMKEITQLTQEFGHHEQVKKILILKEPFTEENRMLTPSQKVVRHLVKEKYKKEIDALYQ